MQKARFASLVLSRFDEMRVNGTLQDIEGKGNLFRAVGADIRASGNDPASQRAFKFVAYGLHDSIESAQSAVDNKLETMPWIADAREVWCGVLAPFRQFGEANFIDPISPSLSFESLHPEPPAGTPIVVVTTAGFEDGPDLDMSRVRDFGAGVAAVRISMTATPGLHSQQTFSFPNGFTHDGVTVTFWRDFASMRDFAYGAGLHRQQMKRQRDNEFDARTSFTRFAVVYSEGTWHGTDPLVWK